MAAITKRGEAWRATVRRKGVYKSGTFRTKAQAVCWAAEVEKQAVKYNELQREYRARHGIEKGGMASYDDLLAMRVVSHNIPAVYLLFVGSEIAYIGKSKNAMSRIAGHSSNGRAFTHYAIIPCDEAQLDETEAAYIKLFTPPGNKQFNNATFPATITPLFFGPTI